MTPWERKLWYCFLNRYEYRFQRQKEIDHYIVDFYCHEARLVIEVDGSQHFTKEALEYDQCRTAFLESLQLTVIRFTNRDVDLHFDAVCQMIDHTVMGQLFPNPSDMEG